MSLPFLNKYRAVTGQRDEVGCVDGPPPEADLDVDQFLEGAVLQAGRSG